MFYIPFRKNILVADACERICPPMGLSAPPATKVMVAPGSAVKGVMRTKGILRAGKKLTLYLVR
jgi:hypothetical protein